MLGVWHYSFCSFTAYNTYTSAMHYENLQYETGTSCATDSLPRVVPAANSPSLPRRNGRLPIYFIAHAGSAWQGYHPVRGWQIHDPDQADALVASGLVHVTRRQLVHLSFHLLDRSYAFFLMVNCQMLPSAVRLPIIVRHPANVSCSARAGRRGICTAQLPPLNNTWSRRDKLAPGAYATLCIPPSRAECGGFKQRGCRRTCYCGYLG